MVLTFDVQLNFSVDQMSSQVEFVQPVDEEIFKTFDSEPDETLVERIVGLTEMVPLEVRIKCKRAGKFFLSIYRGACDASWIFFTTGMIFYGPVLYETERQRQIELPTHSKKVDETSDATFSS